MPSVCYVDTSAVVKRYVEEPGSDAFDAFCEAGAVELVISPLVPVELTGTLRRRVRGGEINPRYASEARRRFSDDVSARGWVMIPFGAAVFSRASDLMLTLGTPLATLDALHLACALLYGVDALATADRQLAAASRKARLQVHTF